MAGTPVSRPAFPVANKSEAWTLHDTNEISANGGFIPDADGSFVGRLRDDDSDRTFNVLGGLVYPLDIKLAKDDSKSGVASLLVLRKTA